MEKASGRRVRSWQYLWKPLLPERRNNIIEMDKGRKRKGGKAKEERKVLIIMMTAKKKKKSLCIRIHSMLGTSPNSSQVITHLTSALPNNISLHRK